MNRLITEGLDYHDLKGQIEPTVSVDEYASKMGKDSDIVTLAFIVKSKEAGNDLSAFFEKGYTYVLDASLSTGEIVSGKWLLFVEMNRRSTVPERIIELLSDMETLTDISLKEWTISVNEEEYDADETVLKQVIICNPNRYKKEKEEELNEYRTMAGLQNQILYDSKDAELRDFVNKAGL